MATQEQIKAIRELLEPINSGEYELKKYFRSNGWTVTDVSADPRFWGLDIDLIIEKDNYVWTIEVKYDHVLHRSGNLFIEHTNPRSKDGKGWYHFCKADFLFYGDAATNTFYAIGVEALHEYIEANKENLREKGTADRSYGWILPLKDAPVFTQVEA